MAGTLLARPQPSQPSTDVDGGSTFQGDYPAPLVLVEDFSSAEAPMNTTSSKNALHDAPSSIALDVSNATTPPRSRSTTPVCLPPRTRQFLRAGDDSYDSEATLDIDDIPLNIGAPLERMAKEDEVIVVQEWGYEWSDSSEGGDVGTSQEEEDGFTESDYGSGGVFEGERGIGIEKNTEDEERLVMDPATPRASRHPTPHSASDPLPVSSSSASPSGRPRPARHNTFSGWTFGLSNTFGLGVSQCKAAEKKLKRRSTITQRNVGSGKGGMMWRFIGVNSCRAGESEEGESDRIPESRETRADSEKVSAAETESNRPRLGFYSTGQARTRESTPKPSLQGEAPF